MKHIHFKCIDSTNTYIKNNYTKLKDYTFVSAKFQSNGHGRYLRSWVSNSGENLLFSLLIKNKDILDNFQSLSIISGVAISKALEKLSLQNVKIKWPNDVYVNDKKICGILLESISGNSGLNTIALGIGININQSNFIDNLNETATSIFIEKNKKYSIKKVRKIVFKSLLKEIKNIDSKSYLDYFNSHNYLYDKMAYAIIDNKKELVKIKGINDDNTLQVLLDGRQYNLLSDEISFHQD